MSAVEVKRFRKDSFPASAVEEDKTDFMFSLDKALGSLKGITNAADVKKDVTLTGGYYKVLVSGVASITLPEMSSLLETHGVTGVSAVTLKGGAMVLDISVGNVSPLYRPASVQPRRVVARSAPSSSSSLPNGITEGSVRCSEDRTIVGNVVSVCKALTPRSYIPANVVCNVIQQAITPQRCVYRVCVAGYSSFSYSDLLRIVDVAPMHIEQVEVDLANKFIIVTVRSYLTPLETHLSLEMHAPLTASH